MPLRSQTYSTPGSYTWTAPAGVQAVIAMILGAGSGGSAMGGFSGPGGGGGGSGQWVHNKLIPCVGGTLAIVVGIGGAGAVYNAVGSAGGNSSVGPVIAFGSPKTTTNSPATAPNWGLDGGGILRDGGGLRGGLASASGVAGTWGNAVSPHTWGGAGGGGDSGGISGGVQIPGTAAPGTAGIGANGTNTFTGTGFYSSAGMSGASSPFGPGGNGGDRGDPPAISNGDDALYPGAGGGGAGSGVDPAMAAGDGGPGIVILTWVEP